MPQVGRVSGLRQAKAENGLKVGFMIYFMSRHVEAEVGTGGGRHELDG